MKMIAFLLVATLPAVPALASDSNDNPYQISGEVIDEAQAVKYSRIVVEQMIGDEQLDESWSSARLERVSRREYDGQLEWVITYVNPQEEIVEEKTLYIFLSLLGDVIGANFIGE